MASSTLQTIQALVQAAVVKISDHGFDELIADDISIRDVMEGISGAIEIED